MQFQFFDPKQEVLITERNLPHWEQAGAIYFITFRTLDSLPGPVLMQWLLERNAWLAQHGIDADADGWKRRLTALSVSLQREFHETFTERWHALLDAGHGECVLKRPDLSQLVADSLLFFHGERYFMGDFVVMPNHVHMLVQFPGYDSVKAQCKSWKRYTARQINDCLGRRGHFWQDESFDHIVRSEEQYVFLKQYITDNPVQAGLRPGQFFYHRCQVQ